MFFLKKKVFIYLFTLKESQKGKGETKGNFACVGSLSKWSKCLSLGNAFKVRYQKLHWDFQYWWQRFKYLSHNLTLAKWISKDLDWEKRIQVSSWHSDIGYRHSSHDITFRTSMPTSHSFICLFTNISDIPIPFIGACAVHPITNSIISFTHIFSTIQCLHITQFKTGLGQDEQDTLSIL